MAKLLLTYGTRPITQRIANLLTDKHEVVLATYEEIPSVLVKKFKSIPNAANPVFAHEMLKLCLDQGVDYLLPLGLSEIETLKASTLLFEEYGIQILIPSLKENQAFTNQIPSNTPIDILKDGQSLIGQQDKNETDKNGIYVLTESTWIPVII
ncbi:hypothetical protein ACFSQ3_15360 [Sphingobacterium corticis]|uniref:Uncharacterized protein n=1 Tax=Sphingobacterium corticis TaxID=1812823 RepID=A0ABW5NML1_9SPHI